MRKVEIVGPGIHVTSIELLPKNWWARLILAVAHWSYKIDCKPIEKAR